MPRAREGLFERGSNVVDYWLAHCEGFKLGKANGRMTQNMRLAIIRFQKKEGLLADGHPSQSLLQRLRSAGSVASEQKT